MRTDGDSILLRDSNGFDVLVDGGKTRELIAFCERRQIVPDLVARCRELFPKVEWEGEYE